MLREMCWPDHKQALLLQAAFRQGDAAVDAWRQWTATVDLEVEHLEPASYRLLPLVYRNLSAHGVDDRWLGRLKGVTRRAWYKNQCALRSVAGAVEALRRADIEALLLNDVALAVRYCDGQFPNSLERVDVLVPSDSAAAAARTLLRSGWHLRVLSEAVVDDNLFRLVPACSYHDDQGHRLHLHWQLPIQAGADDARVWWDSVPLRIWGVECRALCGTDELLHVCARGLLSMHTPVTGWVADALMVLTEQAVEIDWCRAVDLARELRLVVVLRRALCYLSLSIGAPVPASVLLDLDALPTSGTERCEFLVFNRSPRRVGGLFRCWFQYRRRLRQDGQPGSWLQDAARFWAYLGYQEECARLRAVVARLGKRGLWRTNRDTACGG